MIDLTSPEVEGNEEQLPSSPEIRVIPSPFKLTRIRDAPAKANVDTIGVKDILGDPMIKEVWLFDFLFDVDWVMQQFDSDVRDTVDVVIVHGSWRNEDPVKIHIDEASKRYSNLRVVTAHMPERFGTHHTKCMVIIRHDDSAQVVVHTANMIEQDWRNMTQGAWLSPLLPLFADISRKQIADSKRMNAPIGSGIRFKHDFLTYLRFYDKRTASLVKQLELYDFSAVRGALIAHVPEKCNASISIANTQLWGWPALRRALSSISCPSTCSNSSASIVCQISSIATLPDKWIQEFFYKTLQTTAGNTQYLPVSQFKASVSIIYPTPPEIQSCLDGYAAGGSIHCKTQTPAQQKQVATLKNHLCHWNPRAATGTTTTTTTDPPRAHRGPAAPHIKTFTRFSSPGSTPLSPSSTISWSLLTSANLSTQAWGTSPNLQGEVRVCSYELGVLVWPALWDEYEEDDDDDKTTGGTKKVLRKARMMPTFGTDTPTATASILCSTLSAATENPASAKGEEAQGAQVEPVLVGLRMPYDLPLSRYSGEDVPWAPGGTYAEPDRFGRAWGV